jgi:hypothetical protein
MDIENIRKLTPYQDINGLLGDWVEGIKNIPGGNVVGLYLSGSLSYGGFVRFGHGGDSILFTRPRQRETNGLSIIIFSPSTASRRMVLISTHLFRHSISEM